MIPKIKIVTHFSYTHVLKILLISWLGYFLFHMHHTYVVNRHETVFVSVL